MDDEFAEELLEELSHLLLLEELSHETAEEMLEKDETGTASTVSKNV